jgi:hypothetical protein
MTDYVAHGGRSRGSVLYTDPAGSLPRVGHGGDADRELDLPELFRFTLDRGALDDEVQEAAWVAPDGMPDGAPGSVEQAGAAGWAEPEPRADDDAAGRPVFRWRPRRPIPEDDDFFENVWREFREHGNVL